MSKVLVTGGAGFIGSHLVDRLLDEGHHVTVVDDLSSGKLDNLPSHYNLEFVQKSITEDIDDSFAGIDIVFHLAAVTRPQESIFRPLTYNKTNVEGTLCVLTASVIHKVKRVVFASTADLYGEQETYPTPETAQPHPMEPYGLQKYACEQYCQMFTKLYGLETNCLRFFNVYGKRMNPYSTYSALIPKFIRKIKDGFTPVIHGDGNQSRDFLHVLDLVDALVRASQSQVCGEVFNVGTGSNASVNEVTQMIFDKLGKENNAVHGEPVIEPSQTLADISKAKEVLGWQPQISLNVGLDGLI